MRGDRVITYELDPKRRRSSLHEFISREINPLLESGWTVSDVRITAPRLGPDERCRMEVILVETGAETPLYEATL